MTDALFSASELVDTLDFSVFGVPQPAGSKRAFVNRKTGQAIITDANTNARPWKQEVAGAARAALGDARPAWFRDAVEVTLTFVLSRPKGHYGSGRNAGVVLPSAPPYPVTKPDIDKLSRAVLDALTSVAWHDDAQVVTKIAIKRYGTPTRCDVRVAPVGQPALPIG